MNKPLYETFSGSDLAIAEKIQQRRLQILVHSYIYYELDQNIVPDNVWIKWAVELCRLQDENPKIASNVPYHSSFLSFDGSSGFDLNYNDPDIVGVANKLLSLRARKKPPVEKTSKQIQLF